MASRGRSGGSNSVIGVPQQLVNEVEETFKRILKETEKVRDEHATDMSVHQAISIVLDRHPDLRQVGLAHEVLQWYICRMEAWFAADANMISLKNRDQASSLSEHVLSGGHGLMVQGYHPLIKALSKVRVKKISQLYDKVVVSVDDGTYFIADAAIVTVPLGVLKANLIEFEPSSVQFPIWKLAMKIRLPFSSIKYSGLMWNY
ncbi:putative polyamine oxidase 4 [Acorus gramineus]|uniref:Polyamine oxidase 4 n=1 Tax=Acorus gramineus TaxID=55184 RepID=A0AAV8ZWF8_ACOGR|nr:putative polyamine oxidase 4 [Acorus gramineus]